jgi:hypothetical protein
MVFVRHCSSGDLGLECCKMCAWFAAAAAAAPAAAGREAAFYVWRCRTAAKGLPAQRLDLQLWFCEALQQCSHSCIGSLQLHSYVWRGAGQCKTSISTPAEEHAASPYPWMQSCTLKQGCACTHSWPDPL